MMKYGVKFYKIEDGVETEVEMDTLPDQYICGLIKMLKDDMNSRERINSVFKRIAEDTRNNKSGI